MNLGMWTLLEESRGEELPSSGGRTVLLGEVTLTRTWEVACPGCLPKAVRRLQGAVNAARLEVPPNRVRGAGATPRTWAFSPGTLLLLDLAEEPVNGGHHRHLVTFRERPAGWNKVLAGERTFPNLHPRDTDLHPRGLGLLFL